MKSNLSPFSSRLVSELCRTTLASWEHGIPAGLTLLVLIPKLFLDRRRGLGSPVLTDLLQLSTNSAWFSGSKSVNSVNYVLPCVIRMGEVGLPATDTSCIGRSIPIGLSVPKIRFVSILG